MTTGLRQVTLEDRSRAVAKWLRTAPIKLRLTPGQRDHILARPLRQQSHFEVIRAGRKVYGICPRRWHLVRLNKPLIGGYHLCAPLDGRS